MQDSVSAKTRKGRVPDAAAAAPGFFSGLSARGLSGPGLSAVGAIVRRHDRDRYQTALFAPSDRREALFALYAFNYEVARVRETVTQPMLGQIRLQWWREVVEAAYAGSPARRHEIVQPVVAAIAACGLSRAHFDRIIDARELDLADAPPADLAALVDYAEGTSSALLFLALEVLGTAAPRTIAAAREIGIAYALAGLLRGMPFHAASGRSYIPDEIAARVGLDPVIYARRRDTPALRASGRGAGRGCGDASRGRSAARGPNATRREGGLVTGGDRRPVSAAAEAGRVQPVRARIGRSRPAAKLAPCSGGAAQPVLAEVNRRAGDPGASRG